MQNRDCQIVGYMLHGCADEVEDVPGRNKLVIGLVLNRDNVLDCAHLVTGRVVLRPVPINAPQRT